MAATYIIQTETGAFLSRTSLTGSVVALSHNSFALTFDTAQAAREFAAYLGTEFGALTVQELTF